MIADSVVDVGVVVFDVEASGDEPIEDPVVVWEGGGNNASSVADMDVGVVAGENGAVKLGEEAARLDVETRTLGVDGSVVLLYF